MFTVKQNECVGFDSRWIVKKVFCEGTTQTTEHSVCEKACNTAEKTSIGIATDEENKESTGTDVDMDKLATWLDAIYPRLKRELDSGTNSSRIFKNYMLLDDDAKAVCKLMQTVSVYPDPEQTVSVSAVSWNCSGKSLAVSCSFDHQSWCHHSGQVSVYTLNSHDVIPQIPQKKLLIENCITVLEFHPSHPAILAAGTFLGRIYICNVHNDEMEGIVAKINGHEEFITRMTWINDIDSIKSVLLATSSIDGDLKLWNVDIADSVIRLKSRYRIRTPILGNYGSTEVPDDFHTKLCLSIKCFDFSTHVPDLFIVGTEGGLVVQCSVLGANKLKGGTTDEPLFDPVFKYYEPHKGEVLQVKCSQTRKEMFATTGTDLVTRIYLIGQEEPAQVVFHDYSLNDLSWVAYEEKLLLGCGSKGIFDIFNVQKGKTLENVTNEKLDKNVLSTFDINKKRSNLVVVGDRKGRIQLWNVPWQLFSMQK